MRFLVFIFAVFFTSDIPLSFALPLTARSKPLRYLPLVEPPTHTIPGSTVPKPAIPNPAISKPILQRPNQIPTTSQVSSSVTPERQTEGGGKTFDAGFDIPPNSELACLHLFETKDDLGQLLYQLAAAVGEIIWPGTDGLATDCPERLIHQIKLLKDIKCQQEEKSIKPNLQEQGKRFVALLSHTEPKQVNTLGEKVKTPKKKKPKEVYAELTKIQGILKTRRDVFTSLLHSLVFDKWKGDQKKKGVLEPIVKDIDEVANKAFNEVTSIVQKIKPKSRWERLSGKYPMVDLLWMAPAYLLGIYQEPFS